MQSKEKMRECYLNHKEEINKQRRKRYRTVSGKITNIYEGMQQRSNKNNYGDVAFSKGELLDMAENSPIFMKLFEAWVLSGYSRDYAPSFDRADDYKGYSWGNFNKWMCLKDNRSKAHADMLSGKNRKRSRAVLQYSLDGVLIKEYHSMRNAEIVTGINNSNIGRACSRLHSEQTAGGYRWEYKNK